MALRRTGARPFAEDAARSTGKKPQRERSSAGRAPVSDVLARTRDVTDIDRVQARDNGGESLLALSLLIGRTETVAVHEFLEQLRVNDEVTMVRWRPKVQRFNWFRGPCAV
jgi:hypothetical protein